MRKLSGSMFMLVLLAGISAAPAWCSSIIYSNAAIGSGSSFGGSAAAFFIYNPTPGPTDPFGQFLFTGSPGHTFNPLTDTFDLHIVETSPTSASINFLGTFSGTTGGHVLLTLSSQSEFIGAVQYKFTFDAIPVDTSGFFKGTLLTGTVATPEPASATLFGLALFGLLGFGAFRGRKALKAR